MKEDNDCWGLSRKAGREKMMNTGPDGGVRDKVSCRGCCWARNGCAVLRLAWRTCSEAAEMGAKAIARCGVATSDKSLASLSWRALRWYRAGWRGARGGVVRGRGGRQGARRRGRRSRARRSACGAWAAMHACSSQSSPRIKLSCQSCVTNVTVLVGKKSGRC